MTPQQRSAAELLARGVPVNVTAEKLGVSRRTIARWQQDPEFQSLIKKIRDEDAEVLREKWEQLSNEHFEAALTLREITVQRLEQIAEAQQSGTNPNWNELKSLAESLFNAIQIERLSLSMSYLDQNRAIEAVQKLGYTISDHRGAVDVSAEPAA